MYSVKDNTLHQRHGKSGTPEYLCWTGIKTRTTNKNDPAFARYGSKGITICSRWINSFSNFYADMGDKPSPDHTIERLDNSLGYSPDNCVWATRKQQAINRGRTRMITHGGITLCIRDWERRLGFPIRSIHQRIHKLGWSEHKSLTTPVRKMAPRIKLPVL